MLTEDRRVLVVGEREPFPLAVLLDWQMPETHGGTVLTQLKARHPKLPVIVMSAGDFRDAALRLGGDDYLYKPFTLEDVSAKLGPWLDD